VISRARLRAAWAIAVAADALQLVAFPFFLAGAASPADDVLDLVVAGALTALVGWHWSYLPSFLAKLTPALDLVPTWTGAVYLATRGTPHRGRAQDPRVIEAEVVRPALSSGSAESAGSAHSLSEPAIPVEPPVRSGREKK